MSSLSFISHFTKKKTKRFRSGASPLWSDKSNKNRTALHQASEKGDVLVSVFLYLNGANIESKDNDQQTPLDLAKNNKQKEVEGKL